MHITRTLAAVVLMLVPAFLAAQTKSPCSLLTKADVKEATGLNVGDPKPNPKNAAVCDYDLNGAGVVNTTMSSLRSGETVEKMIAELQKRNMQATPVAGLGDRSFLVKSGFGIFQIMTFKGPNYAVLTMFMPGADEAKHKAIGEKLMRKALPKL